MRPLQFDFQRVRRPLPWLGLAVLVAALAVLAGLAGWYWRLDQQVRSVDERLEQEARLSTHRPLAPRPLTEQAARAQQAEVRQANEVVRLLGLPWNSLFRAIDGADAKNVALLSLEPDLQKGVVRVSGEARNFDALLGYVRELSTRDVFDSVALQSHQVQQDVPEKPVRFALLAQWKKAAP